MDSSGGDMAVSFIGLIALAGLAAVVFLAVLGLITLLTNPKTRDLAKILLGGLAAVVLLVVLVGVLSLGVARQRVVHVHNGPAPEWVVQDASPATALTTAPSDSESLNLDASTASIAEAVDPSEKDSSPSGDNEPATDSDVALPPDPRERVAIDSTVDADAPSLSESVEEEAVTEEPELVAEEPMPEEPEVAAKEAATPPEELEDSNVAELSVAPLPDTPNRPSWVDLKPYKEGSVYCWPIATDPRPDVLEAEEEALPAALDDAVADYVRNKLKLGSMASRQVHLDSDYLRNELVGEDIFIEPLSLSMGEFVRVHALVKFDREANSIIRERWDKQRLAGRLWSAGGFLAVVLLFLSLIYCYLKIDQVTGGSRRALLRFAAILVILGLMLVAAGVASVGIA